MLDIIKKEENGYLSVFDEQSIQKIKSGMNEIARAVNSAGRRDTQFVAKAMNVFLLGRTPYSIMRQCMIKIERSRQALSEAQFRHRENMLNIEKMREDGRDLVSFEKKLSDLEIEKKEYEIEQSSFSITGAIKNIANYLSIYEQVKAAAGIPDDWDELDYERAEAEHHIKQAFLQSLRDVIGPGAVNPGNQEYLENCGIGGIAGIFEIKTFLASKHNGPGPPMMADIEAWLERMYQKYKDTPGDHLRSYGIEPIDEWYVFKDRNK